MSDAWGSRAVVSRLPDRVVDKILDTISTKDSDPRTRFISVKVDVAVDKRGTATISFSCENDVFDMPPTTQVSKGSNLTIEGLFNKITLE